MSKSKKVRLSAAERLVVVRERQAKSLEKATEAVRKAEERLAKVKERLARIEQETPHKVALAELAVEVAHHRDALKALRPDRPEAKPELQKSAAQVTKPEEAKAKPKTPAATITCEDGTQRELSADVVATIKAAIGKRRKGILSPLDGEAAQSVITALDQSGNVGDTFVVAIKGRKPLRFSVVDNGLAFETA